MISEDRLTELMAEYHNDREQGALVRLLRKVEAEALDGAADAILATGRTVELRYLKEPHLGTTVMDVCRADADLCRSLKGSVQWLIE